MLSEPGLGQIRPVRLPHRTDYGFDALGGDRLHLLLGEVERKPITERLRHVPAGVHIDLNHIPIGIPEIDRPGIAVIDSLQLGCSVGGGARRGRTQVFPSLHFERNLE